MLKRVGSPPGPSIFVGFRGSGGSTTAIAGTGVLPEETSRSVVEIITKGVIFPTGMCVGYGGI